MGDEKKPVEQQATAEAKLAEEKIAAEKKAAEEKAAAEKPKPSGLDGISADGLKELYNRSPQMFKEAGIVKEEPVKEEKKVEAPPAVSAAPKYGDVEIKLPEDVKVNREVVERYFAHAKEIGLDAKQVQAQVDQQVKEAREAATNQPKQPTMEEIDAANVGKLKADAEFGGAKYDENMEIARRAAVKFGEKEVLTRLATSDPVLVKHFWRLGLADSEDRTTRSPNRNGNETRTVEEEQKSHLKSRYNHPTSQQMFKGE